MTISQTTLRIGAVLGTIGAIVVLAASAQAATAKPAGMSQAAYRALVIRSEALNKRYGNAVTRLSPRQFSELWNAGGSKMSPDALNALVTRSEGLNARYGNAVTRVSVKQAAAPPITSSTSFSWGDFGIGASATVGLVLLLSGIAVTTRSRRRTRVVSRIG